MGSHFACTLALDLLQSANTKSHDCLCLSWGVISAQGGALYPSMTFITPNNRILRISNFFTGNDANRSRGFGDKVSLSILKLPFQKADRFSLFYDMTLAD